MRVQLCRWPTEKHNTNKSIIFWCSWLTFDHCRLLCSVFAPHPPQLADIQSHSPSWDIQSRWKWTCKYEEDDLSSKFQCSKIDISSLEMVYTSILILHWLKSLLGLDRITSYCCWEKAVIFWWTIKICCFYQTVFQKSWISKPYWLHFRWEVIREMNLLSCTLIE